MATTRLKICGITRPQDAALAAELGADYAGLNFVGGPRRISNALANEILLAMPQALTLVVLRFLDDVNSPAFKALQSDPAYVNIRRRMGCLQIYGITETWLQQQQQQQQKSPPTMESHPTFDPPEFWLPLSIANRDAIADLRAKLQRLHFNPAALVLDTASAEKLGGTGQTFNWHWIAEARAAGELEGLPPIILAGGLNPDNVAAAIRIAKPYAVDVSSGVEIAGKPGIKDPVKLRDFIQAVQSMP